MTAIELAQMTEAEARKLTLRINRDGFRLGELLVQAHERMAWAALGYRSWGAYINGEFTFSRATSYRLLAAERDQDALVAGSERLTDETDDSHDSSNGTVVDGLDVAERPLDTITPDAVLPPKAPAKKSEDDGMGGSAPREAGVTAEAPAAQSSSDPIPEGAGEILQGTDVGASVPAPSGPPDEPALVDGETHNLIDWRAVAARPPRGPMHDENGVPFAPTIKQQVASLHRLLADLSPSDAFNAESEDQRERHAGWIKEYRSTAAQQPSSAPPKRRQGTVTRPADRAKTAAAVIPTVKIERPLVSLPTTQSLARREVAPMFKVAKAK